MALAALLALAAITAAAASSAAIPASPPPYYKNISLPSGVVLSTLIAGNSSSSSSAATAVFLHGFPAGSWMWQGVVASGALSGLRLVAPDLRGYNRSSAPAGNASYALPLLAADVAALIGAVAPGGRVHLVAHDWGGAIAWWLAAARPDLLLSLSIIDMAHPLGWISAVRSDAAQQAASAYVLSFVNPAFTAEAEAGDFALLKSIYAAEPFWPAAEPAYESSWSVAGTVDAALNYYRANIRPHCPLSCTSAQCWRQGVDSSFDAMPNDGITPPALDVLVQFGMLDSAFDVEAQLAFIAKMVRGRLEVVRFPNATHWLPQEQPEAVAGNIAAFLLRGGGGNGGGGGGGGASEAVATTRK
jgi:pimeloyl-ACP methyl ester carboxylesterase